MDFFTELWNLINESNISHKINQLSLLSKAFSQGNCQLKHEAPVELWQSPSYAAFCTIVHGSKVPPRKHLNTREGKIVLLHAIAHIEYSAMDLAMDHAYRFRYLPHDYYQDWLATAIEEARHFCLLENLLKELGSYYGALPVHNGLFCAAQRSQHSLAMRMAAVPRYMEANGLDAHPVLLAKLAEQKDPISQKIQQVLQIIAEEEIEHVKRGNRWFRYACQQEGLAESEYVNLVARAVPGAKFAKKPNIRARLRAGFSAQELKELFGVEVS